MHGRGGIRRDRERRRPDPDDDRSLQVPSEDPSGGPPLPIGDNPGERVDRDARLLPGAVGGRVRRAIESHLGSRDVSRVIYGSIIGLALIVALEDHPPSPGVVVGSLLGTAVAVSLAELYSDLVGIETRKRRHVRDAEFRDVAAEVAAVAFGVGFPAVFFIAAAAGAIEEPSAFTIAKWSGVGVIGFYGLAAARLAGDGWPASVLRALAAVLIGVFLIALKALLH